MTKALQSKFMMAAAMVTSIQAIQANAETIYNGYLQFELNDDLTAKVSAIKENLDVESISIPATVKDQSGNVYKVTNIAEKGFANQKKLTSVILGEHITTIGSRAFLGNSAMTNIYGTTQVTTIGESAFSNCKALQLASFENVERIENRTFSSCTSLEGVSMPKVSFIDYFAFENCDMLKTTTFSDELYYLGNNAFSFCYTMTEFVLPVGINITSSVFYNAQNLKQIVLPYKMTHLGTNAFLDCKKLDLVFILWDDYSTYAKQYSDGLLDEVGSRKIYCAPAIADYVKEHTANMVVNLNSIMKPERKSAEGEAFTFTLTPARIPGAVISEPTEVYDPESARVVKPNAEGEYTVTGDKALISYEFDGNKLQYYIHKSSALSGVSGIAGDAAEVPATVYSLDGQKIASAANTESAIEQIDDAPKGIYIIKQGNSTCKIAK